MSRAVGMVRSLAFIALVISYVLLAHHAITVAGNETLGLLVVLAPLVLLSFSVAWRARRRVLMLAAFAFALMLLALSWSTLVRHYSSIYLLEHAGTQIFLGLLFARSLMQGREPICTYIARIIKGQLPPEVQRYTRQVTIAWVMFFFTMAATSVLLFVSTSISAWSVFANFLTIPLTALMFITEYGARHYFLPNTKHVDIMAAVKAYMNAQNGH